MENLKPVIAKNIAELRTAAGLTQIDLAEKLNYSDKAISKWERAESVPDISVLMHIAELFGVTIDYLVHEEHTEAAQETTVRAAYNKKLNHAIITCISILGVWLVATVVYFFIHIIASGPRADWLPFVYAVPVSLILWLIFNSVWFTRRRNYLIVSLLMWSVFASVFLTLLPFGINISLVFLLGVPGQIIILMCTKFTFK